MTPEAQTLTERMAAGPLTRSETLRYAVQIIDALRHLHEAGRCHGAITPDVIVLSRTGVDLLPAPPGTVEALTPYTPPERLKGLGPDQRSDIFALGTVLYQMITGVPAFSGEDDEALVAAIENAIPTPVGDSSLDRLITNCLVKDPAGRWQRVQQVHMEIKILTFSATRDRAAAMPRPSDPAVQAELRQLHARLSEHLGKHTDRLDQHAERLVEHTGQLGEHTELIGKQDERLVKHADRLDQHAESLGKQDERLVEHTDRLNEHADLLRQQAEQQAQHADLLKQQDDRLGQNVQHLTQHSNLLDSHAERMNRHEESISSLQLIALEQTSVMHTASQTLTTVQEQMARLETELASTRERVATSLNEGGHREAVELQVSLAGELHAIELNVKSHTAAIESIRAAMARTDDFMERVVEALESLQTMVLEQANK